WIAGGALVATAAALTYALWPRPQPAAHSPTVTRLVRRHCQVLAARPGPAGLYASVAFGDGAGVEGIDAVRIVRVEPDGSFAPVPDTNGAVIVAANARAIAVLRDARMQAYQISGRVALIDGAGKPLPIRG